MEPLNRRASRVLYIAMLALACLTLSANAFANRTVGCNVPGTFNYNSLQAAINDANPNGDTITVSGTCREVIAIYNFNNLTINTTPGATLTEPTGDNFQGDILEIYNSQNININGLRIQSNPHTEDTYLVVVYIQDSNVSFTNSFIEGAAMTDGFNIYTSTVRFRGGGIEYHPDGYAMYITGSGANFTLRAAPDGTCPIVQNIFEGLWATTNAAINVRDCAVIRNYGDIGISATNGASISINNPQNAPSAIQVMNGSFGVLASVGATLGISGPMLIQGNSQEGIRVRSARATIGPSGVGPLGPTITGNGSPSTNINIVPAGISVTIGATLDLLAGTITNNSAPGVHLTDNSSARVFGPSAGGQLQISGNQAGLVLQHSSTAMLVGAPSITGNGADLSCTQDSIAYGDGSAIGRVNCPGFKSQTSPGIGSLKKKGIVP